MSSSTPSALFILTLLFALSALDRMQGTVHQTVAFLAAILGIMSFVAFFYLIDYAARMLRPISVLTRVSTAGALRYQQHLSRPKPRSEQNEFAAHTERSGSRH